MSDPFDAQQVVVVEASNAAPVAVDVDVAQHVALVEIDVGSQGPPGAMGPQGPQGAQGIQGPIGPAGPVTSVGLSAPANFTVAGSPVTGAGILALDYVAQPNSLVLAGPATGGPLKPTFRQLSAADITGIPPGTVTSVGLLLPADFSVAGSPVTGAGNLAASWANQTAAKVFASPAGAGGAPSFRSLVGTDLPAPGAASLGGVKSLAPVAGQLLSGIGVDGTPSQRALVNADIPAPTLAALGGIQALSIVAHQWVRGITTGGIPQVSQPATTDLSDCTIRAVWTPAVTCATPGDLSVAYGAQSGNWVRIGPLVFFTMNVTFTPTWTTASGALNITGFPQTPQAGVFEACVIGQFFVGTWQAASQQIAAIFSGSNIQLAGLKPAANSQVFQIASFPTGVQAIIGISGFVFIL